MTPKLRLVPGRHASAHDPWSREPRLPEVVKIRRLTLRETDAWFSRMWWAFAGFCAGVVAMVWLGGVV